MTIHNKPTRYDVDEPGTMFTHPTGEYVKHSDYEKLEKQLEEVNREVERLKSGDAIVALSRVYGETTEPSVDDLRARIAAVTVERDAALAQVPKFEWDFDRLKGIMNGEYKHYVEDGTDADGNELGHEELIEWTTIKDILRDGLATMLSPRSCNNNTLRRLS